MVFMWNKSQSHTKHTWFFYGIVWIVKYAFLINDNIYNNNKSRCHDGLFGTFDRRYAIKELYIKNFTLGSIININTYFTLTSFSSLLVKLWRPRLFCVLWLVSRALLFVFSEKARSHWPHGLVADELRTQFYDIS